MVWDIVLYTIGVIMLVKGIVVALFPRKSMLLARYMEKHNMIRKYAVSMALIGLVLILLAHYML